MDINYYQSRRYDCPPCWSLVADIYRREVGLSILRMAIVEDNIRAYSEAFRIALTRGDHGFKRIDAPEDYCIALMSSLKSGEIHHCGIYYKGKVLHALSAGTLYQDIFSLQDVYKKIEWWAK